MTAEPPSGRALSHASDLASIRACVAARCLLVPEQAAALLAQVDEYTALALAAEGVLVDAPALAVRERERAEKAEQERDGFASTIAEIRASMKDDKALCASIRGALLAVQDAHPEVPTTHSAAKRVAGALVNVLDNIVLRHVSHESGHDIKTLCQEIWKLRHGGKPGENLDRKTGASRGRAFVNLEKAHIRAKADLAAAREALALLNSMVICGESHSATSREMVRRGFAAARPDEPKGEG